jgi:hypothetical protein
VRNQAIEINRGTLKCISLSERSQSEKTTCCMVPDMSHARKGKTIVQKKKISVVARVGGGWDWREE